MGTTTDPEHLELTHGVDEAPVDQAKTYLVLSPEERAKGFVQPYRVNYMHRTCGAVTGMSQEIAETYARDPWFYGGTYCTTCRMHRPLDEFLWMPDKEEMSPHKWSDAQRDAIQAAKKQQQET